jgi:hypothetical protein
MKEKIMKEKIKMKRRKAKRKSSGGQISKRHRKKVKLENIEMK